MSGEIGYPDTSSNPDVSRAVNFLILRDLPRIKTCSLPEPVYEIFFFAQSFVIGNVIVQITVLDRITILRHENVAEILFPEIPRYAEY